MSITAPSLTAQIAGTSFQDRFQALHANAPGQNDSARLYAIFQTWYEYGMHEYPEWATYEGYPGGEDRLTDMSMEAIARRKQEVHWPLDAIATIDRTHLAPGDRTNYDLFRRDLETQIEGQRFAGELMPINQLGGIQQDIPQLMAVMPSARVKDYENMLARLRAVPHAMEQTIALMKEGIARHIVPPSVTMRDVPQQVLNVIPDNPAASAILQPFNDMPASIPEAERTRLREEAHALYRSAIVPAYRSLHQFLISTYLPAARGTIGMSALPDGAAWYGYRVRQTTTTNLSPDAIFDLGMREVKRIRGEMDKVIASTGFKGDFAAFTNYLRTDPMFFYTDSASLLQGYRDICKRADPELIRLFGKLPRLPYGVIAVPAYAEKSQTTAYYNPGSPEAGRPGYFYANTYDLKSRPKWEMEALALHEAVPGHHLQISLAKEMEEVPQFRKNGDYTSFVEGWGLYSESLGEEMGFYRDPYSKFGQLTYEMWRAIRLVLDPGIHVKGWTRQQAIDFFRENSGKAEHDIEVEVDRYIAWPGQATAYKVGELKIKELRHYAEEQLGDKFDIRAFHDHVLGEGAIPLDLLEQRIHAWVDAVKHMKDGER
ncbi:MAG TPA: DUF885 domain-containing protein [Candidatus Kapabacteria bacterium]|nr:DUF885 domain-containing protein [Candidatus Kapabacteria bacterium]